MVEVEKFKKQFSGNVVFDDDTGCLSPNEQEFTVVKCEPVFSFQRFWNASIWISLILGATGFAVYHAWLMAKVHEAQTAFQYITVCRLTTFVSFNRYHILKSH